VRAAWAILGSLDLLLFVAGVPTRFGQLQQIADSPGGRVGLGTLGISNDAYPYIVIGIEVAVVAAVALAAIVIVIGKWDDWLTLFVSSAALGYGIYVTPTLDAFTLATPGVLYVGNFLQAVGLCFALIFFYLLPDGRFIPSWTRYLTIYWVAVSLAWGLWPSAPFSLADPFTTPLVWFVIVMVTGWFTCLAAQTIRYRTESTPIQQRQTRWIIGSSFFGVTFYIVLYLLLRYTFPTFGSSTTDSVFRLVGVPVFLLVIIPVPVAIAFAAVRYQLFDVHVIIRRTLIYGPLTAALATIYFLLVVLLQTVFYEAQEETSSVVVALSTLLIASLFRPMRARAQVVIDKRFYRARYDAGRVVERFGASLREDVNIDAITSELLEVVGDTMQPTHISLWLRPPQPDPASNPEPGPIRR